MLRSRFVLLAAVALMLGSCSRERSASQFSGAPVIVISIDTLRADHLPIYGYNEVETPNIDALRRDAILYRNAYSHCPMTLPSHASMLSGLLPTEHQVRNNLGYRFDAARHPTLPQFLSQHGYATGAAVSSYVLRADTGLGAAFDFYDDDIPVATSGAASQHQRDGAVTLESAKQWIGAHESQPCFFLFHIYEPHAPYSAPEPFRTRYADRPYDGEVARADAIVGDLFSWLKERGLYDRAIIVLTSDHGEGLWQHGEDQHGILLYREVLQVPLVVKLPASARAGESVDAPAALIDLFPTVAKLVAGTIPEGLPGLPLIDFLDNAHPPVRRIYSETFYPRIHLGWSELRSLIDGGHHYIAAPRAELYDLKRDPKETNDIASSERRTAASMREELAKYPSGIDELQSIDPEDAKKLTALGYLGSVANTSAGQPLPNPRDMLPYLERIKKAFKLADERRYADAIASLRALVAENPGLFDAWDKLGELLLETGQYEEAIDTYRTAMNRAQRFSPEMALSLGEAYLKAEKPGEAEKYADLAMKSLPSGAHALRARVALARRDFAAAEREAAAAIGTENPQPAMMLLLAEIKRGEGDFAGALAAIDRAAARARELNVPALYRLEFLRGDLLARTGKPEEAIAAYRREISAFPQNTQAYANLAIIYYLLGREPEMNRLLDTMLEANPHPGAHALAIRTVESLQGEAAANRWRQRMKKPGLAAGLR